MHAAENERDEANFVASEILSLVARNECAFQDIAILVRSNSQTLPLEQVFTEKKIPFSVNSSSTFFEKKEIKDLLALVKVVLNPADLNSLFRILGFFAETKVGTAESLKLGILTKLQNEPIFSSARSLEIVCEEVAKVPLLSAFSPLLKELSAKLQLCKSFRDVSETLGLAVDKFGIKSHVLSTSKNMKIAHFRLQMIDKALEIFSLQDEKERELKEKSGLNPFTSFEMQSFVDRFHLDDSPFSSFKEVGHKVQLMSMHASKGLEFQAVFLVGVEDGILPHERSLETTGGEAEERRLFYVALTRAKSLLYISNCSFRRLGRSGKDKEPSPSRFLQDIPEELLTLSETDPAAEEAKRMAAARRLFDMFR